MAAARRPVGEGRRGRLRAVESLAGWVFADMLLVLFLVGIGTAIPQAPPPPPPAPPPKVVKPPKPPEIVGMETSPVRVQIKVDAEALTSGNPVAKRATCAALRTGFDKQLAKQDRAAFVLIFGGGTEPSLAVRVAEEVYPQLKCAGPRLFPTDTVRRTYWDGGIGRDDVRVEAFLYATKNPG